MNIKGSRVKVVNVQNTIYENHTNLRVFNVHPHSPFLGNKVKASTLVNQPTRFPKGGIACNAIKNMN